MRRSRAFPGVYQARRAVDETIEVWDATVSGPAGSRAGSKAKSEIAESRPDGNLSRRVPADPHARLV